MRTAHISLRYAAIALLCGISLCCAEYRSAVQISLRYAEYRSAMRNIARFPRRTLVGKIVQDKAQGRKEDDGVVTYVEGDKSEL